MTEHIQKNTPSKSKVCAAERRLAFLIHSQHSGSSTQQRLHHRGQAVACRQVKGPAGGETREAFECFEESTGSKVGKTAGQTD